MTKVRTYQDMKDELDQIILWFNEGGDLDINKAIKQYEKADKIVQDMEVYLAEAKNEIDKLRPRDS